jgi:hypothetical protein
MNRAVMIGTGVLATFLIGGCAHPFLKSGANLATTIQKGDAAVATLMDAEARTERVYRHVQPATKVFAVTKPDDLDRDFVALVCRPHARALLAERVALNNLEQFRAALEANATDPKDTSLAAMLASMSADAAAFKPQDPDKAVEEIEAKRDQAAAACSKSTRELFVASPPAGALTVAIALAAWPKVRDFLLLLATEANKRKREQAILNMLNDPRVQKSLQQSLDVLSQSISTGRMNGLATSQRQIALWSAYAHYRAILSMPLPPPDVNGFRRQCDRNGREHEAVRRARGRRSLRSRHSHAQCVDQVATGGGHRQVPRRLHVGRVVRIARLSVCGFREICSRCRRLLSAIECGPRAISPGSSASSC